MMAAKTRSITLEVLKSKLSYSPETGEFRWIDNFSSRARKGAVAGTIGLHGYVHIRVNGVIHKAHRLAWLYEYGSHPTENLDIDHINGVRIDNRIENLRLLSRTENLQNQRRATANNINSRLLGSHIHKRISKYQARIVINGVTKSLGYFDNPNDAHSAYVAAKRLMHPASKI
jgi:hypothetical protein